MWYFQINSLKNTYFMKKALIFGVTGQDGAYLSKFLLKNYLVQCKKSSSFVI